MILETIIESDLSFGNTAWLVHIIVNPEFRKKGIGSFTSVIG